MGHPKIDKRAGFVFDHKAKSWIVLAAIAGWFVWISGVFGNSGLLQAYQLSMVRRDLNLRVHALENERQRLGSVLASLEHDAFVQETVVRETLGFVRSNDLVFEFH